MRLGLTLFGDQIKRAPGVGGATGDGAASMLQGAGVGAMLAPMMGINLIAAAGLGASFG